MISMYKKNDISNIMNGEREIELRGLSTDDKPTTVENGTTFIEIDTGKVYIFDKENTQWKEV